MAGQYDGKVAPYALTPDVRAKLIEAVSKGAPIELACQYARVGYSTVVGWIRAGREGRAEENVLRLLADMKAAEGALCADVLDKVRDAMPDNWQAAAWMLERRFAEHFSRRTVVAVTANADADEMAAALRGALVGMDFYSRKAGRLKVLEAANGNGHAPAES